LLIIAFLVLQRQGEQSVSADGAQKLVSIDSVAVDKVSIKSTVSSIVLEKQGGEWFIVEPSRYKAEMASLTNLVHTIKELEIKSIVSSNPQKQSLFNVDSNGTLVTVFENVKEKVSFYVGESGSSYAESYVRKKNEQNVLLVNAELNSLFSKSTKEWRDKSILSIPQESIKELTYQYGDTTFTLTQNNGAWLVGKDSAQSNVVSTVISSLANLKADDFLDTLNNAAKIIMAQISYPNMQVRFAYDKKINKYFIQSSASSQIYVIEPWKAEQLLKRKKEFIKK
jgi:hypothetical protein